MLETNTTRFGKVLQLMRMDLGVTQEMVAKDLGLDITQYKEAEEGYYELEYEQLIVLAEVYDIHVYHEMYDILESASDNTESLEAMGFSAGEAEHITEVFS